MQSALVAWVSCNMKCMLQGALRCWQGWYMTKAQFCNGAIQHVMDCHCHAYLYGISAVQVAAKSSVCVRHKPMVGIIGVGVAADLPVSSERKHTTEQVQPMVAYCIIL